MADAYHVPVMAAEVIEYLDPQPGQIFVDATLGGGGHAKLLAERLGPDGWLIGLDQDSDAIAAARNSLSKAVVDGPRISLVQTRFDRLEQALADQGATEIDGILFDLGVSSHQLDEPSRGFSFKDPDMPLDMRMDPSSESRTAADLLNSEPVEELTRIFRDYSDERWAARIAQFIGERRGAKPFRTAGDLVDTIKAAVPAAARAKDTIHPATRVFQAVRIAVNEEYVVLERGLDQAIRGLRRQRRSRIAVIAYHSGEDRIVKRLFAKRSGHCECPPSVPVCVCGANRPDLMVITKKPLVPNPGEIAANPRARSAKLRVAQKL